MMLQDVMIYRADFVSRSISWIVRFLISAYLWISIINSQGTLLGYDIPKMLSYFLLIQIVYSFVTSSAGFQVASDIQSGDLSTKMVMPVDYILLYMSRDIGRNTFFFILNFILYIGTILIFPDFFQINLSLIHILLATFSMFLGFIIIFCLTLMIGMLAFWISHASRLIFTFFALMTFLSGLIIPLEFFPENFKKILDFSPFPYLFYFPTHIMQIESINFEIFQGFIIQISYSILLTLACYLIFNTGLKKYEAVGR